MDTKHDSLELADALDGKYGANYGANTPTFRIASELIRRQHARIEELERALYQIADTNNRHYSLPSLELQHKEDIAVRALLTKKD